MALKEDFKDDVLDTSVNTNRTFNILSKTGTVIQTDVRIEETTAFEQTGDDFGAAEINATNKEINRVAKNTCTNLINVFAEDMSASGVYLTPNYDGTYKLSGTASADVYFDITDSRTPIETHWPKLKAGKYKIVGDSPSNGVTLYVQKTNTEGTLSTGVFEVANDNTPYRVRLKIDNGTVLNGLTVKPMLTSNLSATYNDFIQYSGNGELNENVTNVYDKVNKNAADITKINRNKINKASKPSGAGAPVDVGMWYNAKSVNPDGTTGAFEMLWNFADGTKSVIGFNDGHIWFNYFNGSTWKTNWIK